MISQKEKKRKAAWLKQYRQDLTKKGLCIMCAAKPRLPDTRSCEDCRERSIISAKKSHTTIKDEVFEHYGGYKCKCCGETDKAFLHLDHIENNGGKDRKLYGGGSKFYGWLKKNNYPREFKLQVLCMMCNLAKAQNGGVCPHVKLRLAQLDKGIEQLVANPLVTYKKVVSRQGGRHNNGHAV